MPASMSRHHQSLSSLSSTAFCNTTELKRLENSDPRGSREDKNGPCLNGYLYSAVTQVGYVIPVTEGCEVFEIISIRKTGVKGVGALAVFELSAKKMS